jgi:replicative DNA helicase
MSSNNLTEGDFCKLTDLLDLHQIVKEETGEDLTELDELIVGHEPADSATLQTPLVTRRESVTQASDIQVAAPPEDWPVPRALRSPVIPTFPLDALSSWHRTFVEDLADQLSCGVDGPAVISLGILSGAAANTCATRIECDHPVQLWCLWVAETGDGKTPVMDRCRRPLQHAQERLQAAHAELVRSGTIDLLIEQKRLTDATRRAAKADTEADVTAARDDMRAISARLELLKPRRPPRLKATEASPAGLVQELAQPGERLILATDEASEIFGGILRRNRKQEEEFQALLQAYSGSSIEHGRGNGGLYIRRPALAIAGAIQPDAFGRLMKVTSFHDQGLLARFLITKPQQTIETRESPRPLLDSDTEYDLRTASLLRLDPCAPRTLFLAATAHASLDSFATAIDKRCRPGGDLELCRGWARKLRGNVIRLGTVLTLADDVEATEVGIDAMVRAQVLGTYFLEHAMALFGAGVEFLSDHNAEVVLKWIRNRREGAFAHRDAVRAHGGRMTAEDVADALDVLLEHGYLRAQRDHGGGPGRPRGPRYQVHPRVLRPH